MRQLSTLALLFVGYVVAAKIGLSFAYIHPSATAIWPPTGIALAAFLLLGRDAWPAIFAGAFLANATTEGSVATSLVIAVGNTLEGALGAYLVERFARGRQAFDRPPDIFRFVVLGGLLSPMVSATMGVTALSLAGYAPWNDYGSIWVTWWLGDVAGALLVAPLVLVWTGSPIVHWGRGQWLEAALLLLVLTASAAVVFGGFYAPTRNYPLAFLCIPTLVWSAFRFGQLETATAIVILSGVATWGTLRGFGPFGVIPPNERLLLLQAFLGTMAVMGMSIAALVAEHQRLLAAEQRARADAESATLAKDTFLAMLGHELRNPLAAVITAVHVLNRVVSLDDKAHRIWAVIARQIGQLARLVDDMLDVTRVTTGKIVLHRSRLELGGLVTRSLETLISTGKTDRHHVTCDRQPTWVDGDAARLEQVVTNLVTNALKYTPPGGTVGVTVGAEHEWAVLHVQDTGMGIAPEMLPRIFDLFIQGDRGPDRSQGGLGIGLTLVKCLVELHGGIVEAASGGPGCGSLFTVRLPSASPRRATDHVPQAPVPSRPRRVLVIEDQPDAREVLRLALQLEGHEVFEAVDGPCGIEAASRHQPDVAVIDIGLPGCDGYEVARQLRRMSDGETIFLVALSGFGQPEDRRRGEEAGFDVYLTKPIDPERLNALLTDALPLFRARRDPGVRTGKD
jgi:signal transduction histidine kinase/CheY-like chemotaxis protein